MKQHGLDVALWWKGELHSHGEVYHQQPPCIDQ